MKCILCTNVLSTQFNFLLDFALECSYVTVQHAAHELKSSGTDHTDYMSVVFTSIM